MAKLDEGTNQMLDDDPARGTVEALARNAVAREAERMASVNINPDAALYRKADEMALGDVKTDELCITWLGKSYIAQGFVGGILYAEEGKWDQIRRIGWGTTRDAMEGGKTEGAGLSVEPGVTMGGEGRGDRGTGSPAT